MNFLIDRLKGLKALALVRVLPSLSLLLHVRRRTATSKRETRQTKFYILTHNTTHRRAVEMGASKKRRTLREKIFIQETNILTEKKKQQWMKFFAPMSFSSSISVMETQKLLIRLIKSESCKHIQNNSKQIRRYKIKSSFPFGVCEPSQLGRWMSREKIYEKYFLLVCDDRNVNIYPQGNRRDNILSMWHHLCVDDRVEKSGILNENRYYSKDSQVSAGRSENQNFFVSFLTLCPIA